MSETSQYPNTALDASMMSEVENEIQVQSNSYEAKGEQEKTLPKTPHNNNPIRVGTLKFEEKSIENDNP